MSSPYSLRRRLSYGLAAGLAILWLGGAVVAGLVIRHELDEAFDEALRETAQRLLSLAVIDIMNNEGPLRTRRVAALRDHDEALTYVVRDGQGAILLQSHDADPSVFPAEVRLGFADTDSHRLYGEATVGGSMVIQVAEPLDHRREAALESAVTLVIPLALFLPITVVGVWVLVRRTMQPLFGLRTQIEARDAADLSPVQAEDLPEELRPIADAVNRLMDRLHRSLQVERSFAANSAHELRTPIAGALAQTQRLIPSLPDGDLRDRARGVETALQRLARISEKLMQLSRAEGGGVVAETAHDLGPILDAVVEDFRRGSGSGGRLDYAGAEPGDLVCRLNLDAFGILMRNLIENALKHSPAGSTVRIVAGSGWVRVVNDGATLAGELLDGLRKPFARGPSEAEGSGLGLAIASAIASNGEIALDLTSPASGRDSGFEAVVRLNEPAPTGTPLSPERASRR